jgi:aryl-alcohol dehydrogenase-like predicted oxidoreductase
MWGGTDDAESIATLRAAVERGVDLIDTAPVYGFGHSEEILGKALAAGNLRAHVRIATKAGLEWQNGRVFRNASRVRLLREVDDSLRRLPTVSSFTTSNEFRQPLNHRLAQIQNRRSALRRGG